VEDINLDTANTETEEESASMSTEEEPQKDSTGKNSFYSIFSILRGALSRWYLCSTYQFEQKRNDSII